MLELGSGSTQEDTGQQRIRSNKQLKDPYNVPDIVSFLIKIQAQRDTKRGRQKCYILKCKVKQMDKERESRNLAIDRSMTTRTTSKSLA